MAVNMNKRIGRKGQAAIEMAMSLPFIIFLLYYMINAFYAIHTSHIAQKYAAMNVYQRLNMRAQFAVDSVTNQVFDKSFIAVQYTDRQGATPKRRILLDPGNRINTSNSVGICREPACN